jgi:hypothetical protein
MDGCDVSSSTVRVTQWLSYGEGAGHVTLSGQRILIVDEVGTGCRRPCRRTCRPWAARAGRLRFLRN